MWINGYSVYDSASLRGARPGRLSGISVTGWHIVYRTRDYARYCWRNRCAVSCAAHQLHVSQRLTNIIHRRTVYSMIHTKSLCMLIVHAEAIELLNEYLYPGSSFCITYSSDTHQSPPRHSFPRPWRESPWPRPSPRRRRRTRPRGRSAP